MLLFSTEISPWAIIAFIWLAVQVIGFFTRTVEPPGPPGGRVVAVHNDAEWVDAQRDAKDSGTLVRRFVQRRARSWAPHDQDSCACAHRARQACSAQFRWTRALQPSCTHTRTRHAAGCRLQRHVVPAVSPHWARFCGAVGEGQFRCRRRCRVTLWMRSAAQQLTARCRRLPRGRATRSIRKPRF
jgi:hypothetical protein